MTIKEQLLNIIGKGHSNAIPRNELAYRLNISDTDMRQTIATINLEGNTVIINAEDGRGYYIPETPEDIDIALRKNGSRIKKLLAKEECLQAVKKQMMKGGAL